MVVVGNKLNYQWVMTSIWVCCLWLFVLIFAQPTVLLPVSMSSPIITQLSWKVSYTFFLLWHSHALLTEIWYQLLSKLYSQQNNDKNKIKGLLMCVVWKIPYFWKKEGGDNKFKKMSPWLLWMSLHIPLQSLHYVLPGVMRWLKVTCKKIKFVLKLPAGIYTVMYFEKCYS